MLLPEQIGLVLTAMLVGAVGLLHGTPVTCTETVLLQPVDVLVKVIIAVPCDTPVTTPVFVTVATPVLLLDHVPPVVGDNVQLFPTFTPPEQPERETTGSELTFTVT